MSRRANIVPRRCIYGLVDPETEEIHYIGKTVRGMERISAHWSPSILKKDKTDKGKWLRSLIRRGLSAQVVVLEVSKTKEMYALERKWIALGGESGWPLTNMTAGGVGLYRHKFTEEHKAKIGRAHKGKKLTEEHKKKISEVQKGRKMHLAAMNRASRKSNLGAKRSAETRAKIGRAHRGKYVGPSTRAKISKINSLPIVELQSGRVFKSRIEASKVLGVCTRSITRVAKGYIPSVKGFQFAYADMKIGS